MGRWRLKTSRLSVNIQLVDHIELFKVMMDEGVATPVETFFGYTRYIIVENILIPPSASIWEKLKEMKIDHNYVGRYMTRDYESVDVYGIHCDDHTAMILKMVL